MKRVLVTGAAGFIGSTFVDYILATHSSWIVYGLDKLTYAGCVDNLRNAVDSYRFSFIKGDICDEKLIDEIFGKYRFDIVVHFAAETHVDRSIENPVLFNFSNYIGTSILLEASRRYGVERFHYISTDEVYGDLPYDSDQTFGERSPFFPRSVYSASKASADLLTGAYRDTYSLPVSISRCCNNYGPRQYKEKLIPMVIDKARRNEKIGIYGTGENVREWIYVMDHVRAIDMIITKPASIGEVYNVGSGLRISNLELVRKILHMMKKSEDLITFIPDRLGHDRRYALSSRKIKMLGCDPSFDFDDALKRTISSYLAQ